MHLIIDGFSNNRDILCDEGFLYHFLNSYPAVIGMTRISTPFVLRYEEGNPKDWGISGFVFLAESHISIHTFVKRGYVNIDVFSCRNFDPAPVVDDLRNRFQLSEMKSWTLNRGLDFIPLDRE